MLILLIGLLLAPFVFAETQDHSLLLRNSRPLQAEAAMDALDPWETPISGFFIRSHHEVPVISSDTWQITIDGLVEKPLTFSLKDLQKFPAHHLHAVLECSGNGRGLQEPPASGIQWQKGAIGNAEWGGVSLAQLLREARVQPRARFARVSGADLPALPSVPAFVRSIPVEKLQKQDTLLAWNMNREAMPFLHGGPLRLILPGWYAQNWIKWVRRITLTATEDEGFYMKKGYRMPKIPLKPEDKWDAATGNPIEKLRVQSFITTPRQGAFIAAGVMQVRGKAFSGESTIAKVEISLDSGSTWELATVEPPRKDGGWQEFTWQKTVKNLGAMSIWSRATDSQGQTQPLVMEWNPTGYLRNAVDRIEIRIEDPKILAGEAAMQQRCTICHSQEMIAAQHLSKAGWQKVVQKMQTFGAVIAEDSQEALLAYLERLSSQGPTSTGEKIHYAEAAKTFAPVARASKLSPAGKTLYQKNCAVCHGESGEGKLGPRLAGRFVPIHEFQSAVRLGKAGMPPFATILKGKDILAIQQFLQRPAY